MTDEEPTVLMRTFVCKECGWTYTDKLTGALAAASCEAGVRCDCGGWAKWTRPREEKP